MLLTQARCLISRDNMIRLSTLFILFLTMPLIVNASQCTDTFTLSALNTLKTEKFEIQSVNERNKTAIKLLSCLGYPDPAIRDGVVYEGISHWLRNELLEQDTIKVMFSTLVNTLKQANQDPDNFTQPFAALVFSEAMRVDRLAPYLSDEERQNAVDVATNYMRNIEDYRGFDDVNGWRHAVAHTADVFLQLSLNKNISKAQLDQLLSAIKTQVSPQPLHFYTYGEPKRLAFAFIYIVLRGEHEEQDISSFLDSVVNPTPFTDWNSVYHSQIGLAKLHNTRSFIYSIFTMTAQSENPKLRAIQPILAKIIQQLG